MYHRLHLRRNNSPQTHMSYACNVRNTPRTANLSIGTPRDTNYLAWFLGMYYPCNLKLLLVSPNMSTICYPVTQLPLGIICIATEVCLSWTMNKVNVHS